MPVVRHGEQHSVDAVSTIDKVTKDEIEDVSGA